MLHDQDVRIDTYFDSSHRVYPVRATHIPTGVHVVVDLEDIFDFEAHPIPGGLIKSAILSRLEEAVNGNDKI